MAARVIHDPPSSILHPLSSILFAALLIAATILAYQPAWNAGFIWDDDDYVTNNPLLTAPDGLKRIWFSKDSPSQYFPLTYTTFRIERALWGLNPAGYHWVNILLHAANALLVWRLLSRLKIPGAWLAAGIFALHPVQVESVAWISELKNVQSLFFCLLALLAWVAFVARGETEKRRSGETAAGATSPFHRFTVSPFLSYALALLFYALALFSKTTACTLPAALPLILWLKKRPINFARIVQLVPFVLLGLSMGLVSIWWERHHQGTEGQVYAMSFLERVLVASRAVWFYLGKLLWPANLTFNYPLWKIAPADLLAYVWLAAGAGLCAVIFFARRFVGRGVEVAALFYVATLAPLLGFVMLYTFRYTFVADHYQYVAMLGPAALVAAGVTVLLNQCKIKNVKLKMSAQRPRFLHFSFFIFHFSLLAVLATLTWRQSRMYSNLETLWTTTIARNPNSFMAHNNLGAIFLGRGQVDEAIARFQRALEIFPTHVNAHGNLGHALLQLNRVDDALAHFHRALEIEPGAKAHSDLGFGLLQKGRVDEAIAHCRKALEIQPGFAEAHNNLGWALLQNGQPDDALAHFQCAAKILPASADTFYNLGTALLHQGRADEAIAQFQKAIELRPDFAKGYNNVGSALFQKGQPDEAISYFQTALKLQPDLADARSNLANSLFQKGRVNEAVAQLQQIAELQPGNAEVQNNFGWALLQAGRVDEAIARFETVLRIQPDFAVARNNLSIALLRKEGAGSPPVTDTPANQRQP